MPKTCVAVVMGGISPEHDVSLNSGMGMYNRLNSDIYDKFPILISRQNHWLWPRQIHDQPNYLLSDFHSFFKNCPSNWNKVQFPVFPSFPSADIFLLGLHGIGGEDGTLQGFLDLACQPYTGSNCLASALAMDKIKSKLLFQSTGINTPAYLCVSPQSDILTLIKKCESKLGFPCVIKDPLGGSSLGVNIAKNPEDFTRQIQNNFSNCPEILIEEYLVGREVSCGYIQNFKALPPTEIIPNNDEFFNYEAKYQSGRTQEITPAQLPEKSILTIQNLAEKCHKLLGLSGYSRSDFILNPKGIFVLETNSLPGFTDTSILPQEAAAAGLNYQNLLTKIIQESMPSHRPGGKAT